MKKSFLSTSAVLLVLSACFSAPAHAINGTNPRPEETSQINGTNPRPQIINGTNPRPDASGSVPVPDWVQTVLILLHIA